MRDFKTRLQEEIDRYSSEEPWDLMLKPCDWWKDKKNRDRFLLLYLYFEAYWSFHATSTSSELVFNINGMVMTKQRKNMDMEGHRKMFIPQDYLKKRVNNEEFRLCPLCPQPPSPSATYKISCSKHIKDKPKN